MTIVISIIPAILVPPALERSFPSVRNAPLSIDCFPLS